MAAKLGDFVKDKFTPFEGVVTGLCDYLYGCKTVLVRPNKLDDKGSPVEAQWMDEDRVEVLEAGFATKPKTAASRRGGDKVAPKR